MTFHPDLQRAVNQHLADRNYATCMSCGKPFIDHIGIVGTCAALLDARAQLRHMEHVATLAKERADKADEENESSKRIAKCYSLKIKELLEEDVRGQRDALRARLATMTALLREAEQNVRPDVSMLRMPDHASYRKHLEEIITLKDKIKAALKAAGEAV